MIILYQEAYICAILHIGILYIKGVIFNHLLVELISSNDILLAKQLSTTTSVFESFFFNYIFETIKMGNQDNSLEIFFMEIVN